MNKKNRNDAIFKKPKLKKSSKYKKVSKFNFVESKNQYKNFYKTSLISLLIPELPLKILYIKGGD